MTRDQDSGALAVVTSAGWSTVQDEGRVGWAGIGVPRAGAWHRGRYRRGQRVLGQEGGPSLELLAGVLSLRMEQQTVVVASGPSFLEVEGRKAPGDTAVVVAADATVVLHHHGAGPSYLAMAGWEPARTLGSASVDTFSGIGGYPLRAGAVLTGHAPTRGHEGRFLRSPGEPDGPLRVMPTEEAEWSDAAWEVVASARSGVRMTGRRFRASGSAASAPMVLGAIQATPSGEVIILGPDGGITGGYPVVGVVISADLDRVSTLTPGASARFVTVSMAEAFSAATQMQRSQGTVIDPAWIGQAGGVDPD